MADTGPGGLAPDQPAPLLVFGPPTVDDWHGEARPQPRLRGPGAGAQGDRHGPAFSTLVDAIDAERAALYELAPDVDPELVIVFDIAGTVEGFLNAVSRIPGMEFLADFDEGKASPSDDFFLTDTVGERIERFIDESLYLVMTNAEAVGQLLSLWGNWVADPEASFAYGLGRWKRVFEQLRSLRRWGPEDRVRDTGLLDDWRDRLPYGPAQVPAEVELWFRRDQAARTTAEAVVRSAVERMGGQTLASLVMPEIGYHALRVEVPRAAAEALVRDRAEIDVVVAEQVMFVSPAAQLLTSVGDPTQDVRAQDGSLPSGEPVVALLDGLPLAAHVVLDGRVIIDDPDGLEADYPSVRRRHGTAMASLICHGDLSRPGPALENPLYVRPILRPDPANPNVETMAGYFSVDMIHRAVHRLFEGEGASGPAAPSVKVINLSIGDNSRPFLRRMSALARLVDWLAYTYNVLIIVSAGNHPGDIVMALDPAEFDRLQPEERAEHVLRALGEGGLHRRLLSPAESVNALTVAATHDDGAGPQPARGAHVDLVPQGDIPAAYNPIGPGFRRAVKPEVLLPGGRHRHQRPLESGAPSEFRATDSELGPGLLAATPGLSGSLTTAGFSAGTSNAAALASRASSFVVNELRRLGTDEASGPIDDQYLPVLAKALLVHSASWGGAAYELADALGVTVGEDARARLARHFGYGVVDPDRLAQASLHRAVIVGSGSIVDRQVQTFGVPLPPVLRATTNWRRLVITLAWLSPISATDRRHRVARLWVDPPTDDLQLSRQEADWQAVRRGTVQHEILEGDRAVAFTDGDLLEVKVNCRSDGGSLAEPVRFGLVVSLELAETVRPFVYDQIRERLRARVQTRT